LHKRQKPELQVQGRHLQMKRRRLLKPQPKGQKQHKKGILGAAA
jgi:hypothetical protein